MGPTYSVAYDIDVSTIRKHESTQYKILLVVFLDEVVAQTAVVSN